MGVDVSQTVVQPALAQPALSGCHTLGRLWPMQTGALRPRVEITRLAPAGPEQLIEEGAKAKSSRDRIRRPEVGSERRGGGKVRIVEGETDC
ncbi:hypothetical protein [Amycolatopsis sp. NPDC003861]